MLAHWLARVVIDGREYRWSVSRVEVDDVPYETGLTDLELEQGAETAVILQNLEKTDNQGIAALTEGSENASLRFARNRRIGQRARQSSVLPHGARDSSEVGIDLTQALGLGRSAVQRCCIRGSDAHA